MSIDPRMPSAAAIATSCSNEWPASVAWLASMLTLTSCSSPNFTRKPYTVCVSKSYWCRVGSCGFGSIRIGPVKPIRCL